MSVLEIDALLPAPVDPLETISRASGVTCTSRVWEITPIYGRVQQAWCLMTPRNVASGHHIRVYVRRMVNVAFLSITIRDTLSRSCAVII